MFQESPFRGGRRWVHLLTLLALGLCLGGAGYGSAAEAEWPAPVPNWVPVKPGEHPRLFFRKSDLPALQQRARTPEGQAIIARLKVLLGGGEAMPTVYNEAGKAYAGNTKEAPVGTYTLWHGAGFGLLYQLTGERKYADLGRQCVEKAFAGQRDRDDRYSWVRPGGALRAGPSLGAIAMAYDLCYDGWSEEFRRKVAGELQNYDQDNGGPMTLKTMALTPRHKPGSNHYGPQVGGVGLALLAIKDDPGTDPALVNSYLRGVEKNTLLALTQGFGDHGYFWEHPGPGQIASDTAFVPLLQAMRVAAGKDYVTPRSNAAWLSMRWAMWLIPTPKGPYYPNPRPQEGYGTEYFGRGGLSKGGQFSQGFGAVTEAQKPALLWAYQHVVEPTEGAEYRASLSGGKSYDALMYPHRAVLALVNWPIGVQPRNPAEVLPRAVEDRAMGYYLFRNGWKDENDILVGVVLGARPDGPPVIKVWGLKQRLTFGALSHGKATHFQAAEDGSGVLSVDGKSLGVDYSSASGAAALMVTVGAGAGEAETSDAARVTSLTAGGTTFQILTLQTGKAPEPKVDGDRVVVGGQTIRYDGQKIVFGKMAGPPQVKP